MENQPIKSEEFHVMIDIETLSTRPNATILSIGACSVKHPESNPYYEEINPSQGRHIDAATVLFWTKQDSKPPLEGKLLLTDTLWDFDRWLLSISVGKKLIVWSKGTDFDIAILRDAYESCGVPVTWAYNNVRDYRTLAKCMPGVKAADFKGTRHNALDDAMHQAEHLKALLAVLN